MSERKVFRSLIDPEEAWKIFTSQIKTNIAETEAVGIYNALNRVLADDLFSPISVPPFDRVLMDGYAVNSKEIETAMENNGIRLKVIGGIKAGHVFDGVALPGTCVEVSTGSPMPLGYDSVVMVEYTEVKGDEVEIYRPTSPSENIMSAGSDIRRGQLILRARTTLTPRDLAIVASLGMETVTVLRKPKIGVFSSGDEVVELGAELGPGKIYDINATMIQASVLENGGDPYYLGIIPDTYEEINSHLSEVLGKYDLIIISGGTSAGMGDMLYKVIEDIGNPGLLVHGLKVKPGKPTILGSCNGTPIIGLPGNPASALSIMHLLVLRYIRTLAGLAPLPPDAEVSAIVKQKIRSPPGRHEFKPVNLIRINGETVAFPVPGGSGAITSIGLADGFVQIPEGVAFISPGEEYSIRLLSSKIHLVDLQIIGEYDVLFNRILQEFTHMYPIYRVRFVSTSSAGGKASLKRGECHFATIASFDNPPDSVIFGYKRSFGILFREGLGISTLQDAVRYRMINYPLGTSLRAMTDSYLTPDVDGYNNITKTVYSALELILQNRADFCFGLERDAIEGIEFLPLDKQIFSIVSTDDSSEPVLAFKDFLTNYDLPSRIERGYHI